MELNLERDGSALGSLFQQIINDMKNSSPLWEDFVTKASKLHASLRATILAIAAYLDAFQKIADAATNSRGASKEIGTALTRVCLRHKAVETRLKTFTTAIMDCIVQPLQEKIEDWKRTVATIDKEHAKEYKRCRTELKKRSSDTLRLQKKARKGQSDTIQTLMDSHMQDVTMRRAELEDVEKKALRIAMIEERLRYCTFVDMLQPVVREECEVMFELGHLQEAMESIALVTKDPNVLPAASEELIHDAKSTLQMYPESPQGSQAGIAANNGLSVVNASGVGTNSLGSRKSSVCSISSMNSSGSSNSPGHHYQRSLSQASTATSQTHAVSTWPPHSQDAVALSPTGDRPHTISTAYEKGHQRPPLTVYTFQNPETIYESNTGTSSMNNSSGNLAEQSGGAAQQKSAGNTLSRPPLPVRCSSLERPLSANSNNRSSNNLLQRQCPSPIPAHITKELSAHLAQQQHQQQQQQQQQQLQQHLTNPPTYVNMSELANMAAMKNTNMPQQQQQNTSTSTSTTATLQQQHSVESISSQLSNDSAASASMKSQTNMLQQQQHTQHTHSNHTKPTRSHSISSSSVSVSSNTASLHSHPSIESTVASAASLMGQSPSSGSSTPHNHYSPLLTNSPSSTAAGTPSGVSISSSIGGQCSSATGIGNFMYNVNSPTPPSSSNQQLIAAANDEPLNINEHDFQTDQPTTPTSTPTNNENSAINPTTTAITDAQNTIQNTNASAADTDSPTIVENDERSRASVLQKASMFEKQAAAAAAGASSTPTAAVQNTANVQRSTSDANNSIYGVRQPQQQQQHTQLEQQDVDKCFEDSIQELNNLIGELDSFQREIDESKQRHAAEQQQLHSSEHASLGGSKRVETTATLINAATTLLAHQQQQQQQLEHQQHSKQQYCASSIQTNSSGCGTDISDTTSDEVNVDDTHNNNDNNNHLKIEASGCGGSSNYNSDSELSRCYVSETSSLAGGASGGNVGYENPTFAHFVTTAAGAATTATSVSAAASIAMDDSIGDSRSLFACSDSISHNSDTLSMQRQHVYDDTDLCDETRSAVVVIYDHQIPITPDIDYVKQNSEIVVLRTKDPQQLQMHEMRELQQLPDNLSGTPDSPDSPTAAAVTAPTATVAPAKQRLSSFRASSDQQLQLLGHNNSRLAAGGGHVSRRQHLDKGGTTRIARRSSVNAAKPPPPVRRSSSVTPSHNATTGQPESANNASSATNLQHIKHNSLNNSTESLPPPPAFLLDAHHTHSTPGTPTPLHATAAMPLSTLKVAETVKALSAVRHIPASPTTLRRLQQQQLQQQQHSPVLQSFRTSSPGIYAQPKVITNMSSFRNTSPGPNGHHLQQPQAQHATTQHTAQPKTNPNLIAQLNARLNSSKQQNANDGIYGTAPAAAAASPNHQQQPHHANESIYMRNYGQQQHNYDDYGTSNNSNSNGTNIADKTSSIRAKTKAEFLENLNAKLAKQGMSGRAFAVRNLINSKALPDPRVCHESLMDQIKRGATLKRNQKINDRSAPKIY